ncbi:MAG: hypothetical protein M0Z31_11520 [Clostridia bacterium]|nr:hypothetical protein [Clostridia bacterium]
MLGLVSLSYASFMLGFVHGFDADHMVEMTDFVSQDPHPVRAMKFGLKFGLGHTSTVMVLGLLAIALKFAVPDAFAASFELASGVLLIVLGAWSIHRRFFRKVQPNPHQHGIGHRHPHNHSQLDHTVFKYGPVITGIITGMAGTAGVMLFGPVAAAKSIVVAAGFILLYGVGVITAMSIYGLVISRMFGLANHHGKITKLVSAVTGLISIIIGLVWISRAAGGLFIMVKNLV